MRSQEKLIINHLTGGNTITPMQALGMYGCFRLSARIYDLRRAGHDITTIMTRLNNGKYVATYKLKT